METRTPPLSKMAARSGLHSVRAGVDKDPVGRCGGQIDSEPVPVAGNLDGTRDPVGRESVVLYSTRDSLPDLGLVICYLARIADRGRVLVAQRG